MLKCGLDPDAATYLKIGEVHPSPDAHRNQ